MPVDLRLWLTQYFVDSEATEPAPDADIREAIEVALASERQERDTAISIFVHAANEVMRLRAERPWLLAAIHALKDGLPAPRSFRRRKMLALKAAQLLGCVDKDGGI